MKGGNYSGTKAQEVNKGKLDLTTHWWKTDACGQQVCCFYPCLHLKYQLMLKVKTAVVTLMPNRHFTQKI